MILAGGFCVTLYFLLFKAARVRIWWFRFGLGCVCKKHIRGICGAGFFQILLKAWKRVMSLKKVPWLSVFPPDVFAGLFIRTMSQKSMQLGSSVLTCKCSTMSTKNPFILGSKGQKSRSRGTEKRVCVGLQTERRKISTFNVYKFGKRCKVADFEKVPTVNARWPAQWPAVWVRALACALACGTTAGTGQWHGAWPVAFDGDHIKRFCAPESSLVIRLPG